MKNQIIRRYGIYYFYKVLCSLLAILTLIASTCNESTLNVNQNKNKQTKNMTDVKHPGTIKMTNVFENTTKEKSIKDIPETKWFAYLKDGTETLDKEQATEIVPIVEVRMLSLDEKGNLVSTKEASTVKIKEYGPDERFLRSTTMIPNKKRKKN